MNQNIPILPNPNETDQGKINRALVESLRQIWFKIGNTSPIDGGREIPSLRTLGKGSTQAAAGDHRHSTIQDSLFSLCDGQGYLLNDGSGNVSWDPTVITGSGTINYVARFLANRVLGPGSIIDDGTNVGVGITPLGKFHVSGTSIFDAPTGAVRILGTAGTLSNTDLGISVSGAGPVFAVADWTTFTKGIFVNTSTGNFGAGISPDASIKASIGGNLNAVSSDDYTFVRAENTSSAKYSFVSALNDDDKQILISRGGTLQPGTTCGVNLANLGQLVSSAGYGLLIQQLELYPIWFATNDSIKMTITAAGNVAIGYTASSYKLQVAGDVNIASTYHYKINGANLSYTDVGADASGAAAAVQTNLTTHIGLTGTSVHGLGSAATHAETDFEAAGTVDAAINGTTGYLLKHTGAHTTGDSSVYDTGVDGVIWMAISGVCHMTCGNDGSGVYFNVVDNGTSHDAIRFQAQTNGAGDYTVLRLDATTNGVIIGQNVYATAPTAMLDIRGSFYVSSSMQVDGDSNLFGHLKFGHSASNNSYVIADSDDSGVYFDVTDNGTSHDAIRLQARTSGAGDYTVLRLDATADGVIIGQNVYSTAPTRALDIYGATAYLALTATSHNQFVIGSDSYGFVVYDDTNDEYRMAIKKSAHGGICIGYQDFNETPPDSGLRIGGSVEIGYATGTHVESGRQLGISASSAYLELRATSYSQMLVGSDVNGLAFYDDTNNDYRAAFRRTRYAGLSIGVNYAGHDAPSDGLIVEGKLGVGSYGGSSKIDVVGDIYATSSAAITVQGDNTDNNGATGVMGTATCSNVIGMAIGVKGYAVKTNGLAYGVYGDGTSADFYSPNNTYAYGSSRRWKKNIRTLSAALAKVHMLRGVEFDWDAHHGGQHSVGFIAEEVGEVLPEAVVYEEGGQYASAMRDSPIISLLVEAVKELRVQIKALETNK